MRKLYDPFALSQCSEKTDQELVAEFGGANITIFDHASIIQLAKATANQKDGFAQAILLDAGLASKRLIELKLPVNRVSLSEAIKIGQLIDTHPEGLDYANCDALGIACKASFNYSAAKAMELQTLESQNSKFGKPIYRKLLGATVFASAKGRIFAKAAVKPKAMARGEAEAKTDSQLTAKTEKERTWNPSVEASIVTVRFEGCSDKCCSEITQNSEVWIDCCTAHGGESKLIMSKADSNKFGVYKDGRPRFDCLRPGCCWVNRGEGFYRYCGKHR